MALVVFGSSSLIETSFPQEISHLWIKVRGILIA